MNIKYQAIIVSIILVTTFEFTPAEERPSRWNGNTQPEIYKTNSDKCYVYPKMIVLTETYKDRVGQKIIIGNRVEETDGEAACMIQDGSELLKIEGERASWFYGIDNRRIFIAYHTGPAGTMEVFKIGKKKPSHVIHYDVLSEYQESRFITYERFKRWVKSKDECPDNPRNEYDEFQTGLSEEVKLDLKSGKEIIMDIYCRYFM